MITGLRYTDDEVESTVVNFFGDPQFIEASAEEITGKIAVEYDFNEDTMGYLSYTRGFKPGGSNLTFGFEPGEFDFNMGDIDNSEPVVFPAFEGETINAFEVGLKTDFFDNRIRANIAAFYYNYKNMQFQATDPNVFQGGVANIPKVEMKGLELELIALLTDDLTLDVKMSALDSEIAEDYLALDNVLVGNLGFAPGDDVLRLAQAQNVNGNEMAKSPGFTMDASLTYFDTLAGYDFRGVLQYTRRGELQQRIFNNPDIDTVDAYNVVNLTLSLEINESWSADLMGMNLFDKDGINSKMTDVFGVNATGVEYIPPRQIMGRVKYNFY